MAWQPGTCFFHGGWNYTLSGVLKTRNRKLSLRLTESFPGGPRLVESPCEKLAALQGAPQPDAKTQGPSGASGVERDRIGQHVAGARPGDSQGRGVAVHPSGDGDFPGLVEMSTIY